MTRRRIAVTGLGVICPVGNTVKAAWDNILAGKSGIRPLTNFDVSGFSTRFGGTINDFSVTDYISPKDVKKMDPFMHYGLAAGIQAFQDSGVEVREENADRIGVAIGAGIGGLWGIEQGRLIIEDGGPKKISPFYIPSNIINMIAGNLSIKFGLRGPNFAIVTACSTGTHCIGDAARIIERGDADVMVAGGAEMATTPTGLGGFCSARALSTRNDDPETASRPWDRDRDGFVLSDGAGVIVLEEYEHAKRRGARIYVEVTGYGINADAYHMTAPSPGGQGAARCMQLALRDAAIDANEIDYINAHGTSTPAGDKAETDAVKLVFKDHAYKLAVSSTKSMVGHMLGAAGGVEAIFCILALRDQVAPPTINLFTPDPECDLDYVPNEARAMRMTTALSNSFGFGGTNGTLVFRKV
ncbi:MAG: 3-oxoacyl-[acyl-carrier-protein] synthase 2 [Chromatiales bacterium USCg_Taylor]|nr:MAG: 3-oxoacyl-[acyl-carrier-protein] synthase 2 [Chromatiales bacterium USCg_Taylor]